MNMEFNKEWKSEPRDGCEFVYRYYDSEGKSYIGHTRQSLCSRAGGIKGTNYTRTPSKFQKAISTKGFDYFEYEILEEVPIENVDEKEKFYIQKFNSRQDGYNSTYGGKVYFEYMNNKDFVIDLKDYNENQISTLLNNIVVFLQIEDKTEKIDEIISKAAKSSLEVCYTYYAFEGEYLEIFCHPVVLFFNFICIMTKYTWESQEEIYDQMSMSEILGGDILTSGTYNTLQIKLLNGKTISFRLDYC